MQLTPYLQIIKKKWGIRILAFYQLTSRDDNIIVKSLPVTEVSGNGNKALLSCVGWWGNQLTNKGVINGDIHNKVLLRESREPLFF